MSKKNRNNQEALWRAQARTLGFVAGESQFTPAPKPEKPRVEAIDVPKVKTLPTPPIIAPRALSDEDIAFSTRVDHLLPARSDIPPEFDRHGNPYRTLAATWFYAGLKSDSFRAKPGVDRTTAIRHCKAILNSFEPEHGHKLAGVAYLCSLWFDLI